MYKNLKVIIFPTNEKASLIYASKGMLEDLSIGLTLTVVNEITAKENLHESLDVYRDMLIKSGWTPQQLYILSDKEIKEKSKLNTIDYYYIKNHYNEWYVGKFNGDSFDFLNNQGNFNSNVFICKKIVATTDKSLMFDTSKISSSITCGDIPIYKLLPQLSQSFIQEVANYYNENGKLPEIKGEYECDHNQMPEKVIDVLKINSDNTVNLKIVEDSYSKKEVIELLKKFRSETYLNMSTDKWIEENL